MGTATLTHPRGRGIGPEHCRDPRLGPQRRQLTGWRGGVVAQEGLRPTACYGFLEVVNLLSTEVCGTSL